MRYYWQNIRTKLKIASSGIAQGCIVLNYHGLVEEITEPRLERNYHSYKMFDEQVRFVLKSKQVISIEELQYRLENKQDISNCALITFDDGYKNNITAREILDRIQPNIPYTIFVVSGIIGKTVETIWAINLSLLFLKGNRDKIVFRNKEYSLRSEGDRNVSFNEIRKVLKKLNTTEKDVLYNELMQQFDLENLAELLIKYPQFVLMNWEECRQLLYANCSIESHGFLHELQHKEQETHVIRQEIVESKNIIFNKLGHKVISMAYPNGDYSPYSQEVLKEADYRLAFTTKQGVVTGSDNKFLLNRITPSHAFKKFISQLA